MAVRQRAPQLIDLSSLLFLHRKRVIHPLDGSSVFLQRSCEGLGQLLEALWRNLDSNVEQMGAMLRPAWQEITTACGLLERVV